MARIRTIKPEFWTSKQVMECSPLARQLFIGVWNFCDDAGNHPMSAKTLKALVFLGDDITSAKVGELLAELSTNGLIDLCEVSGKECLHVNGWKHQKIDRPTIKHPAYRLTIDADSESARRALAEEPPEPRRALTHGREGEYKVENPLNAHEPFDPREMVAMTLDWLPDPETLKTYAVHVGLFGALFTPAAIALFTCHYEPKGVINTQAEWVPNRSLAEDVVATVSSTTAVATETGQALQLNAQKFGPAAVLSLRSVSNADARKLMSLKLVGVAAQSVPVAIKVLILGDSIANRQGGTLLKLYLQALGINPVFIGTMKGSSSATPTGNALGEAREGWKTGDYTNASTDRALIIAPGDELAYLAMSKADQRDRNPFARAATGSDSRSIVRNGYVFDPAFYQSRFNLDTPEIVLHMMGTNNARASSLAEIYDQVLSGDTLIHSQIRAAWPSAKIIRTLPGTAYDSARNKVWEESYLPMIRGMEKSAANRADSKVIIAPVWAMMNPECGYEFTAGTIGDDGFYTSGWSDPIHPYGSSRAQLYRALTPYVAAAALNLI